MADADSPAAVTEVQVGPLQRQSPGPPGLIPLSRGQFLMMLDSSVMNVSMAPWGGLDTPHRIRRRSPSTRFDGRVHDTGADRPIIGRKRAFAIGCVIYGAGSLTTVWAHEPQACCCRLSCLRPRRGAILLGDRTPSSPPNSRSRRKTGAYGLSRPPPRSPSRPGRSCGALATLPLLVHVFAGRSCRPRSSLLARRSARRAEAGFGLDLVGTRFRRRPGLIVSASALRSLGFAEVKAGAPEWTGLSPTSG